MNEFTITASQCRGARAMLGWSRAILAKKSRVSERTVTDFERGARAPIASTKLAIKTAFETAGIEFLTRDGRGVGVQFRAGGGET